MVSVRSLKSISSQGTEPMNLNQVNSVIAALDKKAEDYKAAADSLRVVLAHENSETSSPAASALAAVRNAGGAGARKSSAGRKAKGAAAKSPAAKSDDKPKRTMSPETRAKIAAKIKARHEPRKQGA
jgi:ABC-type transporter Mla subunit MlaD